MYLLVNVLERTEQLPAILAGFAKAGVRGTTILNSTGMGRILMKTGGDMPELEEAKKVLMRGGFSNQTIFAVIQDKAILQKAIDVVKSFCGDLDQPGTGILFAFPLEYVEGLKEAD